MNFEKIEFEKCVSHPDSFFKIVRMYKQDLLCIKKYQKKSIRQITSSGLYYTFSVKTD